MRKPQTIGIVALASGVIIGGIVGGVAASQPAPSHRAVLVEQASLKTTRNATTNATSNGGSITAQSPPKPTLAAGGGSGTGTPATHAPTSAASHQVIQVPATTQANTGVTGDTGNTGDPVPPTDPPPPTTTTTDPPPPLTPAETYASVSNPGPDGFSVTVMTQGGLDAPTGTVELQGYVTISNGQHDGWLCFVTLSGGGGMCAPAGYDDNGYVLTQVHYSGDSEYASFDENDGALP